MSSDSGEGSTVSRLGVKDLEIRPFARADLVQLPRLLKECLGRTVEASYLDWKFFGGPYGTALGFMVALHEGRLVAFIGANPVPFSVDGELSLIYQHQDTAIREDCRSLALLRAMTDEVDKAFGQPPMKLTYSITTPHMRALVTKRMKYTVVWEDLKLVKMVSLRGMVSKATKSAALASILPGPMTRSWKAPASMSGDVSPITEFGPEFTVFWAKAKAPGDNGRIFGWGEPDWLNYKFLTDKAVPFRCFAYREAGEVIGYLVLNVTQLEVRVCYVDVLWTVPGRSDVVELLLDFALREATRHKCDQVAAWSQLETPLGRAMSSQGFVRRPTSQCLSVKQGMLDIGDLGLKGEHWNLQRGHTYYTSVGHLEMEEGTQRLYQAKESRDAERSDRLRTKK